MKVLRSDHIIYFDGWCNLCTGVVRFIRKIDKREKFRYVSLQSAESEELLKFLRFDQNEVDSILYYENGEIYSKSEAFFHIMQKTGGVFMLLMVFRILPRKLTDKIYDFIARNRYKWFGKKSTCSL